MSGVDFEGRRLRKGATDAICTFVQEQGGEVPQRSQEVERAHFAAGRHAAGGRRRRRGCWASST